MSNIISFIGLRSGVGNSALVRIFAVEAAESLDCVVVDFDYSSSSTYDWALRRSTRGFRPSISVERQTSFNHSIKYPGIELVMVDASNCGRQSAIDLAKISRVVVISTTTDAADLAHVTDQMKEFSAANLSNHILVALCRVQSRNDASSARKLLTANGAKVLIGEIGVDMWRYPPLEREGRALCESSRPSMVESASLVVDAIQKAFVDGIEGCFQ